MYRRGICEWISFAGRRIRRLGGGKVVTAFPNDIHEWTARLKEIGPVRSIRKQPWPRMVNQRSDGVHQAQGTDRGFCSTVGLGGTTYPEPKISVHMPVRLGSSMVVCKWDGISSD